MSILLERRRTRTSLRSRLEALDQGTLVLGLIVAMLILGGLTTQGFLTTGNLSVVLRFSAAIGVVAIAQAFVVLGRGVDLSVGAMALVAGQVTLELMSRGWPEFAAIGATVGVALILGLVNGFLVAVVGVPALLATLGTGQLLLGGIKVGLLQTNLYSVSPDALLRRLGMGNILGIPTAVFWLLVVIALSWFCWTYTSFGRLLRAIGDNPDTAWQMGGPVRRVQIGSYLIAALLSAFAGYLIMAREGSVTTTGTAFSPLLFAALTAVVIGGVSLSGGRGSVLGIVAGTIFISLIVNLLTLNSLSPALQDLANALTLVVAIVLDAWLHPRDEETAKSGDL